MSPPAPDNSASAAPPASGRDAWAESREKTAAPSPDNPPPLEWDGPGPPPPCFAARAAAPDTVPMPAWLANLTGTLATAASLGTLLLALRLLDALRW